MIVNNFDTSKDFDIKELCYQVPLHPKNRKGFSESYIRKKLEKRGWTVWRGGYLHAQRKPNTYPNVKKKYERLKKLLGDDLNILQYICVVHHGMPDFLVYKSNTFKFIECKLGYESVKSRQKKTISVLKNLGYNVEIHRVLEHPTQKQETTLKLHKGKKTVVQKQHKITKYL